ncbi:FGGY family carbohydrate kinase [Nonomuraea sp. MCN248]|uniref:FGGY family carbohydrate kinase n=1 Tax=Nonomuraea corallina TaxID=2989783 RepID=A0ABT4SJ84_9ACTN|nr:FGGY family carbohydrate kinase [Nonomuraea corallina]MDA0637283.1 FGGY family carbohydrate kinase [Nonomuraea corallina]
MSAWIGIDLGTQSVRAMAVDADGRVLGAAVRPLTSHRDGVRHEQDPEEWWAALSAASREALREVPPVRIEGVAVDATSGTVLLTTPDGTPLTPALMYDDRRAAGLVDRVNAVGAPVWERLGYRRMQANWALPKLLWLLADAPAGARAGARAAHQSDFVNRRLCGREVATDLSNALKTGVDLLDERWPSDVLSALGVPASALPEVVRPGTRIGTVCAEAARATGIPEGAPVIAGTTDGCAAQLGAGALTPGSWNSVLGTTLVLKGVTRELVHDPLGVVYSHRAPDGSWLPGGASSTGAGVLSRDLPGRDLDALAAQATARYSSPGSDRPYDGGAGGRSDGAYIGGASEAAALPIVYPLVSRGERFPFAAPDAEGFTLGEPADDVERYAAILRGAAFVERLCFDYLDLLGAPVDGEIILTGGATRSGYGNQLRADVLGRPVTLRENAEPALGMAVLAAGATTAPGTATTHGTPGTAGVAARMVRTHEVVEPSGADLREPYLRFVTALEERGWLPEPAAAHARERSAR